jgi:hypothetical protein
MIIAEINVLEGLPREWDYSIDVSDGGIYSLAAIESYIPCLSKELAYKKAIQRASELNPDEIHFADLRPSG